MPAEPQLLRIEPEARFFTIDNGALFDETYATKRALEERYGIEVIDNPEIGGVVTVGDLVTLIQRIYRESRAERSGVGGNP